MGNLLNQNKIENIINTIVNFLANKKSDVVSK